MTVDKTKLLGRPLPEAHVDVPDVGTLRVRGLSRVEVMAIRSAPGDDASGSSFERRVLAAGLLDPELSEDEVEGWRAGSIAGEIEPVLNEIVRLSGLAKGADKAAYKEFESDSDAEFRVLPGDEAGDDGGPPEG